MGKSIILPWANTIRENVGNMGITVSLQTTSGQAGSALSIKIAYQMVILMLLSMENIRLITGWQEACISGVQ